MVKTASYLFFFGLISFYSPSKGSERDFYSDKRALSRFFFLFFFFLAGPSPSMAFVLFFLVFFLIYGCGADSGFFLASLGFWPGPLLYNFFPSSKCLVTSELVQLNLH